MSSPYSGLPKRAYWKTGVAERPAFTYPGFFRPKFEISMSDKIVTAGSCFAQHVGRTLKEAGLDVVDAEPVPTGVPVAVANTYGYRLFTARYGNIYTTRQLLQLYREAFGDVDIALPVWEKNGRFYDSQRPNVEPKGLPSEADVLRHRADHLERVKFGFGKADVFVFTFGLTETWEHIETGTVYPTAPGTIAGTFDADTFAFKNFTASEVLADFLAFRDMLRRDNPDLRFVVTVSPVPLTATASGEHVEVATTYSKSVLRAVCGELAQTCDDIEYFPSFEIITSQTARGMFYEPNMRSVAMRGVQTAMETFTEAHGIKRPDAAAPAKGRKNRKSKAKDVCEDLLLEAFAK